MNKLVKFLVILLILSLLALPLVGCAKELTLTVSEPKDGATLTESPVAVSGTVSDPEATITVNDVEVEVVEVATTLETLKAHTTGDGSFFADIELAEGENTITVVATLGEKVVTKTITITYTPSE